MVEKTISLQQSGTLYVVATPIGNLKDISLRALDILRIADKVVAEDTRVTRYLLQNYQIKVPLLSMRGQNELKSAERIIALLAEGKTVVQVSDAGTPAISDPGALLCQLVRKAGYPIVPIPGASACITALSVSGFLTPHFLFYGFLPSKKGERQASLGKLKFSEVMLVFYEAPHRIIETLQDCCCIFGEDREALVARELTKKFETLYQGELSDILKTIMTHPTHQKGEFVLVVDRARKDIKSEPQAMDRVLKPLLKVLSLKEAVKVAAEIVELPRNALYERALFLKRIANIANSL